MPIKERDIVLQGRDGEDVTIDLPITRLANVESGAEVKETPDEGDYIPIVDAADNEQMKKFPVQWLRDAIRPKSGNVALEAIKIASLEKNQFVYAGGRVLTLDDVLALTNNKETAISEQEKAMFKDENGDPIKRIVYDGYISSGVAKNTIPVPFTAYATEPTSKVTVYDRNWNPITDSNAPGQSSAVQLMTRSTLPGPLSGNVRNGMDDMGKAWGDPDYHYKAQQRIYIDVEATDGKKGYYVLVVHNAEWESNGLGHVKFKPGYPQKTSGALDENPRSKYTNGSDTYSQCAPGEEGYLAAWCYPAEEHLEDMPPNAVVTQWSTDEESTLSADQKKTVTDYGTVDKYGNAYPLAIEFKVPICYAFRIRLVTDDPRSWVSVDTSKTAKNYNEGKIEQFHCYPFGESSGTNGFGMIHLCGRVKSQEEFASRQNNGRCFDITIKYFVPEELKAALRALGLQLPVDAETGETEAGGDGTEGEGGNETA